MDSEPQLSSHAFPSPPPSYTKSTTPQPNPSRILRNSLTPDTVSSASNHAFGRGGPVIQVTESFITTTTIYTPTHIGNSDLTTPHSNAVNIDRLVLPSETKARSASGLRVDKALPNLPNANDDNPVIVSYSRGGHVLSEQRRALGASPPAASPTFSSVSQSPRTMGTPSSSLPQSSLSAFPQIFSYPTCSPSDPTPMTKSCPSNLPVAGSAEDLHLSTASVKAVNFNVTTPTFSEASQTSLSNTSSSPSIRLDALSTDRRESESKVHRLSRSKSLYARFLGAHREQASEELRLSPSAPQIIASGVTPPSLAAETSATSSHRSRLWNTSSLPRSVVGPPDISTQSRNQRFSIGDPSNPRVPSRAPDDLPDLQGELPKPSVIIQSHRGTSLANDSANRRRSVSLFNRKPSIHTGARPDNSRGNMLKPSPLMRKLSKSLLSSGQDSGSQSLASPRTSSIQVHPQSRLGVVEDGEGPEAYLRRMLQSVNRVEVAGLLASSKDTFLSETLGLYMRRFRLHDCPLDMALRYLLLEIKLPTETQQIDRILGAFAQRYEDCNPGLFGSPDNTYILSYSLVLLHSDAFNPANRSKMRKTDYVRNTKLPGVFQEVLEYFYDNITFQPFKRANAHPDDFVPRKHLDGFVKATKPRDSPWPPSRPKQDVYHFLEKDILGELRIDVSEHIPATSPFRVTFSISFSDMLLAFNHGVQARHVPAPKRRNVGASGTPTQAVTDRQALRDVFRIVKAEPFRCADDPMLGLTKSPKIWKRISAAVLTGSQLLLFRDQTVLNNIEKHKLDRPHEIMDFYFLPDEVVSLHYAFAVKVEGQGELIRLHTPTTQCLLQPSDSVTDWISLLNYASAFRSSGLHMRTKRVAREVVDLDSHQTQASSQHLHIHHSAELHISPTDHPRVTATRSKLAEVQTEVYRAEAALEAELRYVRNLAILTPIQKLTRDRLEVTLEPLGGRIRQLRLQIARLHCVQSILQGDLVAFLVELEPAQANSLPLPSS